MKIAKVEHVRCNEYDCATYIWIPDDMTLDEFERKVRLAAEEYHDFIDEWTKLAKYIPYIHDIPNYRNYPDKTIKEIDELWAELRRPYVEFKQKEDQAKQPFSFYLEKQGFKHFSDFETEFVTEVDHGHRHRSNLEYENTFRETKDFQGPLPEEDPYGY